MATPVPLVVAEGWLWFYGLVHVLPHAQVLYAKMHADEVLHRVANVWTLGRVCSAAAFLVYYAFLKLQVRIAALPSGGRSEPGCAALSCTATPAFWRRARCEGRTCAATVPLRSSKRFPAHKTVLWRTLQ